MRFIASLLLVSSLMLTSVSSAFADPPKRDGRSKNSKEDEALKPPFVGMSKAQALARYGEPKTHTEQWVYVLNFGEVLGKAFIPFNFKPTPVRTGVLTFGANGKEGIRWDRETKG